MNIRYTAAQEDLGKTVKHILKLKMELSERLIKKLKYDNKILVNSVPVYVNVRLNPGDIVDVFIDFVEESEDIIPEEIALDIIFEDDCLIVINKQPNIVVHPTSFHPQGTIANAVMFHLTSKGIYKKVRPVSRLDRDTSGIIIFAKNQFIQESLIRQMADKTFCKEYIGVVNGIPDRAFGTIDLPIARKPGSIIERHIEESGSPSVTHYKVLEELKNAALLKFVLETGRTHQIRVHCRAIGHSLIGDTLYSDKESAYIKRQALHSFKVSFLHPATKQQIVLTAPIPDDIKSLVEILRK